MRLKRLCFLIFFSSAFFKDLFYSYWKGGYTKRKDRKEDLLCNESLHKRPQQLEPSQSKARSLFQVSHLSTGSQGFGPSSTAFPGHKQGAGWEVVLPGLEPVPIWDPGSLKSSTLSTRLPCRGSRLSKY